MSLLSLKHVTLRFGGLTAIQQVDLEVEEGQIFSVIGPNGAGKTSLFNVITGLYAPTEGEIFFQGKDVRRPFALRTMLGLLSISGLSAVLLFYSVYIEQFWETIIAGNYVYQEAFPWRKALSDFFQLSRELLQTDAFAYPVAGAVLGLVGGFVVWRRGRRSPDVVARAGVCRTFQNIRLFQQMTVLENVLVGMDRLLTNGFLVSLLRLPGFYRERKSSEARAREILEFVGLTEFEQSLACSLPYGYQRRLEIARALASQPKLLLLDEPAAGMNPSESVELMELIRKIRETGITVLLIEHHMRVVMEISDRIAVLDYGNKIAEGTPEEIRANAKVIAAYLGNSEV